jgi:hypothetical protein
MRKMRSLRIIIYFEGRKDKYDELFYKLSRYALSKRNSDFDTIAFLHLMCYFKVDIEGPSYFYRPR